MAGYDKVASLMTGDKGLSIFRSFKKLNATNLLYLQAEITLKENELKGIIQEDQDSQDPYREKFSGSVLYLKGVGEPSEQWEKWLELRELLEKYSEFSYYSDPSVRAIVRVSVHCGINQCAYPQTLHWRSMASSFGIKRRISEI